MMAPSYTREEWLNRLAALLRPDFETAGSPLPDSLKVSCGWPTRRALASSSSASRTLGQCFSSACSAAGKIEVFVSPKLSDSLEVAAVLVHELVHAALDCEGGHGPVFRRLAVALGLEGKMTSTVAGDALRDRLRVLVGQVGCSYPHAELDVTLAEKKQGTRMIKLECGECGYTVRTTAKWIAVGLPVCVCGEELRPEGDDGEGESMEGLAA